MIAVCAQRIRGVGKDAHLRRFVHVRPVELRAHDRIEGEAGLGQRALDGD